jgi:hypothetical protein
MRLVAAAEPSVIRIQQAELRRWERSDKVRLAEVDDAVEKPAVQEDRDATAPSSSK